MLGFQSLQDFLRNSRRYGKQREAGHAVLSKSRARTSFGLRRWPVAKTPFRGMKLMTRRTWLGFGIHVSCTRVSML